MWLIDVNNSVENSEPNRYALLARAIERGHGITGDQE